MALSFTAFWTFAKLDDAIDGLYERDVIGVKILNEIAGDIQNVARNVNRVGLSHFSNDPESIKRAADAIIKFKPEI